jgi:hypothetical protein
LYIIGDEIPKRGPLREDIEDQEVICQIKLRLKGTAEKKVKQATQAEQNQGILDRRRPGPWIQAMFPDAHQILE